ncbi:hypothetical protein AB432_010140 [Brevibacillus brevis]|uniref:Uncharacterized protein n=1 Tax=Brevibacillus brevis TaxID=1393 RepID=A0A2Z4MFU1_BREBE|nr:hypothetical protein [Brevibacillus brevis]AWX55380.1 hypothetical protein AB432_010140 [Brevibacillus brevis]
MVAVFIRTAFNDFRKTEKQLESCMPLVQDAAHKVYMKINIKTIDSDLSVSDDCGHRGWGGKQGNLSQC